MNRDLSNAICRITSRAVPYRILIIDDDDNLLFAQYATEYLGYQSIPATSGGGAIAKALTYLPDLILLDVLLRDISGIDILRRLRQHEQLAHIPIVAVTAMAMESDRELIGTAGFSDYLAKPYMLEDLGSILIRQLFR